jgi:hypothetical protein
MLTGRRRRSMYLNGNNYSTKLSLRGSVTDYYNRIRARKFRVDNVNLQESEIVYSSKIDHIKFGDRESIIQGPSDVGEADSLMQEHHEKILYINKIDSITLSNRDWKHVPQGPIDMEEDRHMQDNHERILHTIAERRKRRRRRKKN